MAPAESEEGESRIPTTARQRFSLARFAAISQFSGEVVTFLVIGFAVDHWQGWLPWGTIAGGIVGLIIGMVHLIRSVQP